MCETLKKKQGFGTWGEKGFMLGHHAPLATGL